MAKTDTQIGIRLTSEFKARMEAQAQRERRSLSNLLLLAMEEYLERNEPKDDGEPPPRQEP